MIAVFVVFVYFFGLDIPLVGPDEPRYAQVAREMFERGDWITPTLGGFHWFEKPALLYWLQIASYKLFGVSEFAARFGAALFGLGTVASLWVLGRNLSVQPAPLLPEEGWPKAGVVGATGGSRSAAGNEERNHDFANWLALIAASSIGNIVFSRGASFDIILTFPMTAALVSFFIFDRSSIRVYNLEPPATAGGTDMRLRSVLPLIFFFFFIGVSLLAKGLVGIVFPFAIVGFYYLLSRRFPDRTFIYSLLWGVPLAAAIACLWYLPMYQRHGYAFIDEFFIQHHFQRYTSNKYFHPQPFYFFLWVLPLMTIPWLPFFVVSLWHFGKNFFFRKYTKPGVSSPENPVATPTTPSASLPPLLRQEGSKSPGSDKSLLLFSAAWIAVPLVFFSFSGSKLPGYILPAVPPAVILITAYIWRFVGQSKAIRILVRSLAIATLVVVLVLLQFVVPGFADADSVKRLIETANERGYASERVLNFYTVSHNAEFYAAGRLLRREDGKQKMLLTAAEVLNEIESGERPVLVLMPIQPQFLQALRNDPRLSTEVLTDNGELLIAVASRNY